MDRGGHHRLGDDQHVFQADDHDQVRKDLTAQHQQQQSHFTAVASSAPKPWNALPQSVREAKIQTHKRFEKECYLCLHDETPNAGQSEADSLTAFCRHLKTHQFSERLIHCVLHVFFLSFLITTTFSIQFSFEQKISFSTLSLWLHYSCPLSHGACFTNVH